MSDSSIHRHLTIIKTKLDELFPSVQTPKDLAQAKTNVTAIDFFLNKDANPSQDPHITSKIESLKHLEQNIQEISDPKTKAEVQGILVDQVRKKLFTLKGKIAQMKSLQSAQNQQEKFRQAQPQAIAPTTSAIISKKDSKIKTAATNRIDELRKHFIDPIPLSPLATLEAAALSTLALPIYEKALASSPPDKAAKQAIEEARQILTGMEQENPSLTPYRSSLSGNIIRNPVYVAIGDTEGQDAAEYFEQDEIQDYVVKHGTFPHGIKDPLKLADLRADSTKRQQIEEHFANLYNQILIRLDHKDFFSKLSDQTPLLNAAKQEAEKIDRWERRSVASPALADDNRSLESNAVGILSYLLYKKTLDEGTAPLETMETAYANAKQILNQRFEEDPILSHYECPITHAVMQNPVCVTYQLADGTQHKHYYEKTSLDRAIERQGRIDPISRQPFQSALPATEMLQVIQNRKKIICESIIQNPDLIGKEQEIQETLTNIEHLVNHKTILNTQLNELIDSFLAAIYKLAGPINARHIETIIRALKEYPEERNHLDKNEKLNQLIALTESITEKNYSGLDKQALALLTERYLNYPNEISQPIDLQLKVAHLNVLSDYVNDRIRTGQRSSSREELFNRAELDLLRALDELRRDPSNRQLQVNAQAAQARIHSLISPPIDETHAILNPRQPIVYQAEETQGEVEISYEPQIPREASEEPAHNSLQSLVGRASLLSSAQEANRTQALGAISDQARFTANTINAIAINLFNPQNRSNSQIESSIEEID